MNLLADCGFEVLSCFEYRYASSRDVNARSGLRVATGTSLAFGDRPGPKARETHLFALFQLRSHSVHESLQRFRRLLLSDA